MIVLADDLSMGTIEKLLTTTGPMGAAISLLVVALILVWRYVAKPFLAELQPISINLRETAVANKDASMAAERAAIASKGAAEAWQETATVSANATARLIHLQTKS